MSPERERLVAVEAQLLGAISRLETVIGVYHREGRSAADMVEAERLDARKGGLQLALSYVGGQIAEVPA